MTSLPILAQAATPSFSAAAIALIVWPLIACVIVRATTPARGVIAAYLAGWLFLPMVAINTPFVTYDKTAAVSLGMLLAAALADSRAILAVRPRWVDLPMIAWLAMQGISAVGNGNSVYDTSAVFTKQLCVWGIPYLLGRAFLTRWVDAVDLAKGIFIGGLIYAPLCAFEMRFSPFLHYAVYRVWQTFSFTEVVRDGSWRPMVFMQHGLAVGMYMAAASVCGFWLWWTGTMRDVFRLPVIVPLIALIGVSVLVRSTGATALLGLGIVALYATGRTRQRAIIFALIALPAIYVLCRTAGGWTGDTAVSLAARFFGPERAMSLQFRLDNEVAYISHVRSKPLVGFGPGWGFMVTADGSLLVCDSLWIIALAVNGALGLIALLSLFAVSPAVLLRRIPARHYAHPAFSGAVALSMVVLLYAFDNLSNAMFNPVFVLAMGSLSAVASAAVSGSPQPSLRSRFRRQARPVAAPATVSSPAPRSWVSAADGSIDPAFFAPGVLSLDEKSEPSQPGV